MNQKPLIVVLCIAVAILGFMTFSQQKQIEALRQDITILESSNDKEHRNMKSDIDDVKSKADDLESKLDDIEGNVNNMESNRIFNTLWNY
jgi:peptidoglycan hydrolase CwlO-like protein